MNDVKQEMSGAIDHLGSDLKNLRTGRANPGLVERVMVEVYGTAMRLPDVANITAPEAQQILITPYDGSNSNAIGKAIEKANLGMQVVVDGNIVRVIVPQMDESIRKEMVKECSRYAEQCKVSVRNIRRKFNDLVKKSKSDGEISEDQLKSDEKSIQTLTDDFCKKADETAAKKEKEILTI